jgi:hypothetical protein
MAPCSYQVLLADEDNVMMATSVLSPSNVEWMLKLISKCTTRWHEGTSISSQPPNVTPAAAFIIMMLLAPSSHGSCSLQQLLQEESPPPLLISGSQVGLSNAPSLLAASIFPGLQDLDALDLNWGLDLVPRPLASISSGTPRDDFQNLSTILLTAQVLGLLVPRHNLLTKSDLPRLDKLDSASAPDSLSWHKAFEAKVASELLHSLCVLLRSIQEVLGEGAVVEAVRLDHVRMKAVHEIASACNAALHHLGHHKVDEVSVESSWVERQD